MSHSVGTCLWASWWIVFRCIVQGFGKKDYCQKNDRLDYELRWQPTQVQNLLYTQQLQHNAQAWPKLHIGDDQHVPPIGQCTERLLFRNTPLYTDTPNLHTLWALSVFGLGNIWSLSCSKIYMHGYYFPSVAVSFCWVMWKTLNFSFFCKICLYDKSFPNHDMMLRVQRANRSSRNNYWREGGQGGARVEGWVVSTPPSSNTSYAPVLTALPLLEFLHHPIAHELVHNGDMFQVSLAACDLASSVSCPCHLIELLCLVGDHVYYLSFIFLSVWFC